MADLAIDKIKESLERQIVTVLDFLFTDNQISEKQVVAISKSVLETIDVSQNKLDLHGNFYKLIRLFPILKPHLQNTLKGLSVS